MGSGTETWHVWLDLIEKENWHDEDTPMYHASYPLELPLRQGSCTALAAQADYDYLEWGGDGDPPELPVGGAYVKVAVRWNAHHYSGPDGEDYDFSAWLDGFELVDDDQVKAAKHEAKKFRRRELYWMKKAGCDQYEMNADGKTRCSLGYKDDFVFGLPRVLDKLLIVPKCSRRVGEVCLRHEQWQPRDGVEYSLPKNHFLDGTGVCRYAGAPYDPEFEGHEWTPSLEEFAKKRGHSVEDIAPSFREQAEKAIEAGKFYFYYKCPDGGSEHTSVKARNRNHHGCGRCSGLLMYDGDCPYYTERKLRRSEMIVPCTLGESAYCNKDVRWHFIVLDIEKGPVHHAWFYSGSPGRPQWNGVKPWAQWWSMSNSYDNTKMWTSYGIPVSGSPNNSPMWGTHYDFHKIRERLSHFKDIYKRLRRIAEAAGDTKTGRATVLYDCRHAWNAIAADADPLHYGLTLYVGGGTNWKLRKLLPQKIRRWDRHHSHRRSAFGSGKFPWNGWDYDDNLPMLARTFFLARLTELVIYQPGFARRPQEQEHRRERRLFDQCVIDPWLRVAFGLEGAPEKFWIHGQRLYRDWMPEHKVDRGHDLQRIAGRCMTEDAYSRLKASWKERYE